LGGSATFTNTNIYDNVAVPRRVYAEFYVWYAPTLNLPITGCIQQHALTAVGWAAASTCAKERCT
jgi:hypothetical protein